MWAQLWRCQHVTVVAGGVLFGGGGVYLGGGGGGGGVMFISPWSYTFWKKKLREKNRRAGPLKLRPGLLMSTGAFQAIYYYFF